jgi:hypothetical protein
MRLVDEELSAYASPQVVGAILQHALLAAGLDEIPSAPDAFARFARGQLIATTAGRLGGEVADAVLARIEPFLTPERASRGTLGTRGTFGVPLRRSARPPSREVEVVDDATLRRAAVPRRAVDSPKRDTRGEDAPTPTPASVEINDEISSVVPMQTVRPPVAVQRSVHVVTADPQRGAELLAALAEVGITAKRSRGIPPTGVDALVLDVQGVPEAVRAAWLRHAASVASMTVVWGNVASEDIASEMEVGERGYVEACGSEMTPREVALYCLSAFL